ncbi:peroxiredoxin family protein [Luteimonas gilva]|nr:TlpA disulfide reductase family protein [Luteimonas gilva]
MADTRKILWLVAALALSLLLMGLLYAQNRHLRLVRDELQSRAFQPYVEMWLPEVWTKTLDGVPIRLGTPPARYQVLYFFAQDCPLCPGSAPAVRALAQRLSRDPSVEMVGVGTGKPDAVRRQAAGYGFRFPVATLSDRRALALFKANSMPLLLVADADGQVRYWHGGAIEDAAALDDALAAMGLAQGNGEPIVIERGAESQD